MGIREDLAARKAEFVSLRALLEAICEQEGVSLKEAAEWLMERLPDGTEHLWCESVPGMPIEKLSRSKIKRIGTAWDALRFVVNSGRFASYWDLEPDDIPF